MILEIASGFVILIFISFILKNKSWQRLPPSPMALPIIGHFHLLGPLLHHSLCDLSSRYGPLMYLQLGSVPCVVISSPELAKEALKTNELVFANRITSQAIDQLSYNSSFSFAPFGPYWKFIKKVSTLELLSNRTLSQFHWIRKNEVRRFLGVLSDKGKAGKTVNVNQELLKLSNNIISQMMLSVRCLGSEEEGEENEDSYKEEDVRSFVREVTLIFGEFNVSDFVWFCRNMDFRGVRRRAQDLHRRFDAFLEKVITEHEMERKQKRESDGTDQKKHQLEARDFLDMLLDLMEDKNAEMQITRDQIKALILDFLTAGTDTTASGTEWAISELINHPDILTKARSEIQNVVGNTRLVEESDVQNLPYIQAILKETFRLHPPVPLVSRKSSQTSHISGYTVPPHTLLFINAWSIGRDPNYWENPLEFNPERFLKSAAADEVDFKGNQFQFLPFGSGRRGCPGLSLALLELHATLAATIQCFELKVEGKDGVVDMTERPGLTVPRAFDLVCVPLHRQLQFQL